MKISVIVPIFNKEQYLDRCVKSLLGQTDKNLEIILVNDGSTDQSGEICNRFADIDDRIKVIHKKNEGVAAARNTGIKVATGQYISFVDADDFLDLNAYGEIYKVIENFYPDCIDFGWKYINDYGEKTSNINEINKNEILTKKIIREKILPPLLNLKKDEESFVFDFVWNKLFKTDIICKNKVFFDEKRRTWEDRVFLVQYLKYCNTYYSMDKCFYNYVSVPNSLSRKYDLQLFDIILQNYRSYVEWFGDEYNFNTKYVYNYWCHSIENMILRSLKERDKKDEIKKIIEKTLTDKLVIDWYKKREYENELEKRVSSLVVKGEVQEAIRMYKNAAAKQIKHDKWQLIKAKIYFVRKVFK